MSTLFPDVPIFPGVPPVFRRAQAFGDVAVALLRQDALAGASGARVTWGIFDSDGRLALEPDSIAALEPSREFRVSDYPVEQGAFRSYNKVALPAETRVTMTKGGTDADREAFLRELDALVQSIELYNVITPDGSFLNRNLVRYDYRRTAERGATLLTVELQLTEIRLSASSSFAAANPRPLSGPGFVSPFQGTPPKTASGVNSIQIGPVQASVPTAAQLPSRAQLDAAFAILTGP
jgi:hypothetical protein